MTKQEIQERIEDAYNKSVIPMVDGEIFHMDVLQENVMKVISDVVKETCQHEFRRLFHDSFDDEFYFYCIKCLLTTTADEFKSEQEAKRKELLG